MKRHWIPITITVGWLFAAITLWWCGWWWATTNRYDDCQAVIGQSSTLFWVCPTGDVSTPKRPPQDGGQA